MPPDPPSWRELTYPLNVFMHILTHEEGSVSWLHYGLFESGGESLATAQERSTRLLLSRLPPPPARLLEAGIGLGTTLHRLVEAGYDAEGITPDEQQIALVRERYGDTLRVRCTRLEDFRAQGAGRGAQDFRAQGAGRGAQDFRAQGAGRGAQEHDDDAGTDRLGVDPLPPAPRAPRAEPYDVLLFQESSQYIDSEALFAKAAALAPLVIVLDEFALRPVEEEGALHSRDAFLAAAARHRFVVTEELDLSAQAAPTMNYFSDRIPAYRDRLMAALGITSQQIDDLITSGARYRERYANGTYGYRLLCFSRF